MKDSTEDSVYYGQQGLPGDFICPDYISAQWHRLCPVSILLWDLHRQYFSGSQDVFSDRIHHLCIAFNTSTYLCVSLGEKTQVTWSHIKDDKNLKLK